jgi:hypothetical protein
MRYLRMTPIIIVLSLVLALVVGSVPSETYGQGRTPRPTRDTSGQPTRQSRGTGIDSGNIAATATAVNQSLSATRTAITNTVRATGTAVAGTPQARTSAPSLPADEAQAALESYAGQVLGISVEVIAAGGLTGEITRTLNQTDESTSAQIFVSTVAGNTYAGVLRNGAASVSYGAGTLTGEIQIDVQGASLGVYSLIVTGTVADADAALALAQQTFPALANYSYVSYATSTGYAWYAYSTSVPSIDPATRTVTTTAQAVILFVQPGGRSVSVTATVGRGEYAAAIQRPN